VPAVEHLFNERRLPDAVVLDSDFIINVLHEGEDFHRECVRFAVRLIAHDVTVVHSPLLRLGFFAGWRRAVRNHALPPTLYAQPTYWDDPAHERRLMYERGRELLTNFLNQFRRYEVRLGVRVHNRAIGLMATYNLKPGDAWLLATAQQVRVADIVSLDSDFRPVDGIDLWNNHVPDRRARARARRRK
jgi:predicted nucleic acid-binding protein